MEQENLKGRHPDMITAVYRIAVVVLLAGILLVQWQVLSAMKGPASETATGPTYGALRAAPDIETRQRLLSQLPLVRIHSGTVDIRQGTVSIDSVSVAEMRGSR